MLPTAPFGTVDGQPVNLFTLDNGQTATRITNYGGIIQSIEVPDRTGQRANVTLGFSTLADYVGSNRPYFGAIIGRYANRIRNGSFGLDGTTYQVPINSPPNCLHGGNRGFDSHVWSSSDVSTDGTLGLKLARLSPDGEEGFPGNLRVEVTYRLSPQNELSITYHATTDQPTVLNLTNHAYFNLAGEGSGDVYDHVVWIGASHYTPIDASFTPTGAIEPLAGTPLDFREPTPIGARLRQGAEQIVLARGHDHNYVLDGWQPDLDAPARAARVLEPTSGRVLEVLTTEPGLQFYSGNFLDATLVGSGGRVYRQGDGFALETQRFPDAVHHSNFPSSILRPGQAFASTTIYRFSLAP